MGPVEEEDAGEAVAKERREARMMREEEEAKVEEARVPVGEAAAR